LGAWKIARAGRSKFSRAGVLRGNRVSSLRYPPEKLVAHMWIPQWIRRLRQQISDTQETLNNQERAIRECAKTCERQQRKYGVLIARAIVRASRTVPKYEETQRRKEHSLQWKMLWVTSFGALAASAAAFFAFWYANTAKQQLIAEQRPWISLENRDGKGIAVIKTLDYARDTNGNIMGVKLYLEHHFQNTGRSPAFIAPYGRLYDYRPDSQKFPAMIVDICDTAEHVTRRKNTLPDDSGTIPWTWMVLPGVPMDSHISYDGFFEDKPMKLSAGSIEKGEFIIFNLGCVIYKTADDKTIHHTGWMAEVSMCDEKGVAVPDREIPIKISDGPIDFRKLCVNHVYLVGQAD
jgi:hypothetical protein